MSYIVVFKAYICLWSLVFQARDEQIARLTCDLNQSHITPSHFLKQLVYNDPKFTDRFMEFDQINNMNSDSSDDDMETSPAMISSQNSNASYYSAPS